MQEFKCKVSSRWHWGIEYANMTVTSPKGGSITIDKVKALAKGDKDSNALLQEIVKKYDSSTKSFNCYEKEVSLTKDQLVALCQFSLKLKA